MTDDEVIQGAELEGFGLCWRPVGGKLYVGFVRGDDLRYPAFGEVTPRALALWPTGCNTGGSSPNNAGAGNLRCPTWVGLRCDCRNLDRGEGLG